MAEYLTDQEKVVIKLHKQYPDLGYKLALLKTVARRLNTEVHLIKIHKPTNLIEFKSEEERQQDEEEEATQLFLTLKSVF
jgi:hypothetical protein